MIGMWEFWAGGSRDSASTTPLCVPIQHPSFTIGVVLGCAMALYWRCLPKIGPDSVYDKLIAIGF